MTHQVKHKQYSSAWVEKLLCASMYVFYIHTTLRSDVRKIYYIIDLNGEYHDTLIGSPSIRGDRAKKRILHAWCKRHNSGPCGTPEVSEGWWWVERKCCCAGAAEAPTIVHWHPQGLWVKGVVRKEGATGEE